MNTLRKGTATPQDAALRERAEAIAREQSAQSPEDLEALPPEETRQMLHELRVHQIELEIQNEDLRRAQADLAASQSRYFDLYDLAPMGYVTVSEQGLILEANLTAATLLGVARGALVTQSITRFILKEDLGLYSSHRTQLFETGEPQACELRMVKQDCTQFWAHLAATAARDPSTGSTGSPQASSLRQSSAQAGQAPSTGSGQGAAGAPVSHVALSDITERTRAEAGVKAAYAKLDMLWGVASLADADVQTLADHILVSITRMSESQYGFYGFVNADESVMTIHAWSGEAMNACAMVDKPRQFPVCQAGVWGEAIRRREPLILNDYAAAHAGKKGLPDGHVALTNLLVVPSFSHGKITAVAAVANRTADYGQDDVHQITAFLGSIQAILERTRAEEALRESEARYKRITEGLTDYQYTVRVEDGRAVETRQGPACATVTGYTAEDFAADPSLWIRMITPEDRAQVQDRVHQLLAGTQIAPMEHRIVRKDGETRWVCDTVILNTDAAGTLRSYEGVIQDITARKRAEEALRAASRYARTLIETSLDPLVTISAEGTITDVNTATEKITGMSRDRLIGSEFAEYFTDPDRARAGYLRVFAEGQVTDYPLAIRHPSGAMTEVLYNASVYRNSHGDVLGVFAAARDITARKRAEEALRESEQRVRRLNEQLLTMVMVLSHDIRGPLVAMGSILKLLLRGTFGKLDHSPATTVQDLLSRCARLRGTAEHYLGKASIVAGAMQMDREVLDLRQDVIDAVLDELADDITRQEIVIDNRLGAIPAGSIAISANKTWLKAVYRNLFTNAVTYGGKGCTISFGFEQRESQYRLNVYNSGTPIAEADREKLFARFERIGAGEGPTPDGVGLGLCLCREIIREHGGEIWYEARPDGSNFVFTISRGKAGDA